MLKGTDTGHAWMRATPDARRALCRQLAPRLGRNEDFLLKALDRLYDSDDRNLLNSPIEEIAKVSVAAIHLRPS